MKNSNLKFLIVLFLLPVLGFAQDTDWRNDRKASVLFGLTQPLFASGFNVELNYIHKRLIFDYSHGASLDFSGDLLTNELQEQGLRVHMPYTTGFGVGYRLTKWLNLRVEPKWHRFEYYYDSSSENTNSLAANNTFSLGLGLYSFFQPFSGAKGALKGITVAPSVRFWPTVSSQFGDGGQAYYNEITDRVETLETLDSGIGFTPLVVNISVGYTLDFRAK